MTTAVAQALRPAVRAALKGCATVLVLATSLHAATLFDPALHFRTITTEHFVIYFHQHEDRLGARLAAIAEDTWQQLREPLGVDPPRRTHVVLADQTELANGYATPVPYNTIVIYATWPRGSEFIGNVDDWLRVAFTHEFTHIVHLDRSEGWARVVRAIFGRTEIAFPNLFLPTWQIEGLATYEESAVTGEGRAHAGDFSAVIGEAARASRLEPLDRVNGGITDWPGGNAPYAYGVAFHEYLASRFGAEKLAELATRTARHVPYTGSLAFKKVFGESLGDLWRDYETSVSSLPAPPALPALPAPTQLTHQGFTITGPRFDPMEPAAIIYASRNADEFPSLYRVTLRDPRPHRIATRYLGSTVAIGRDTVYFDQQEVRRNVGSYSDLYALTRSSGHVQQLTHDARLLDPDLSPDGRTIVAVQARPGARDLVLVSIGSLQPPTITAITNEPETQFNAPRWAPDGRRVAVERHRPGSFSDVIVVDVEAHAETVVASFDDARVVTPAWRPDGRAVVAAVARQNAPFNLFEFPLDGGAPHQLTATTGGATWPDVSPDGTTIAYVGYTPHGFDLFTVPYAAVPRAELQPERRTVRSKPDITDDTTSEAYSPFGTLRPTAWSPIVDTSNSQVRAGAGVAGVDVLGYHWYSASATWLVSSPADALTPSTLTPDWQLAYFYDRWRPTFFAVASTQTSFFAGPPTNNGTPADTTLREHQIEAGVLFPIRHTRMSHSALASVLRSVDDVLPTSNTVSRNRTAVRAAWATTTAHAYGYSISPEDGMAAGTTLEAVRRGLGSTADATTITADGRAYVRGAGAHQTIAVRVAAGTSTGDPAVARTFLLGGATSDLGVTSFSSSAISLLRGFPSNSFAGSHAAVINIDYRFPLARPQRGYGTWPLLLHTLHAAVFGDAGRVWTDRFDATSTKTSLGAELSANIVAGYVFPFTLTGGVAWGHDPRGLTVDRTTAFVRIGKAF